MLQLPEKVTVVDVSARDGLQSFHRWVETETKIRMVNRLTEAGFPVIEVTGFRISAVGIAGVDQWSYGLQNVLWH